jgi:hypothetical protein
VRRFPRLDSLSAGTQAWLGRRVNIATNCTADDLVQPARLELPLLDPQVAGELGLVVSHLLDEPLRVLAADERLDGVAERGRPNAKTRPSVLPRTRAREARPHPLRSDRALGAWSRPQHSRTSWTRSVSPRAIRDPAMPHASR